MFTHLVVNDESTKIENKNNESRVLLSLLLFAPMELRLYSLHRSSVYAIRDKLKASIQFDMQLPSLTCDYYNIDIELYKKRMHTYYVIVRHRQPFKS